MIQKIIITPAESAFCMGLALQRDACKPEHNREQRFGTKYTAFGMHFVGVVGEFCFRKVYGGKINQAILPDGDGHKADVTLPDGRRVEVKSSQFSGLDVDMKFDEHEFKRVVFASLVQVTLPDTGLVFPIWPREEIEPYLFNTTYGHGPRKAFRPWDWLDRIEAEIADRKSK